MYGCLILPLKTPEVPRPGCGNPVPGLFIGDVVCQQHMTTLTAATKLAQRRGRACP